MISSITALLLFIAAADEKKDPPMPPPIPIGKETTYITIGQLLPPIGVR